MSFDEHDSDGTHDSVHPVKLEVAPFVDTGYAKVNAHLDDVEIERIAEAVVRLLQGVSKDE